MRINSSTIISKETRTLYEAGSIDPSTVSVSNAAVRRDAANAVLAMALPETWLLEIPDWSLTIQTGAQPRLQSPMCLGECHRALCSVSLELAEPAPGPLSIDLARGSSRQVAHARKRVWVFLA